MVRPRKVCVQQLRVMVAFMEEHQDFALNRTLNTKKGIATAKLLWQQLASRLNSIGYQKTPLEWKHYWREMKYRAKRRATIIRTQAGTGGGQNNRFPLTEIEERIVSIMGPIPVGCHVSVQIPVPQLQEQEAEGDNQEMEQIQHVKLSPVYAEESHDPIEEESCEQADREGPTSQRQRNHENQTASINDWALEMERSRMEDNRRRTAAIEMIANTLVNIQQQLARLIDHHLQNNM